jgi:hypothetical protein
MKYLLLILALLIALPTAQAGGCGMGGMQDSIEQAAADNHDCCPDEAADREPADQACEDGAHCSGCIITFAMVPLALELNWHPRPLADFTLLLTRLVPSHSAPPYRPPIS